MPFTSMAHELTLRTSGWGKLVFAAVLTSVFPLVTIVLVNSLEASGILDPSKHLHGLFRSLLLFIAHDEIGAWAWLGVFIVGLAAGWLNPRYFEFKLPMIALLIFGAICSWGIGLLLQGYGLADEYLPLFQAEIFKEGRLLAPIPDVAAGRGLQFLPYLGWVDEENGFWASYYRPVHAALLALTPSLGGVNLLNMFMTIAALLAMASICRRLWPDEPYAAYLGACLLIASPQFLVLAGTGFSFPSHLALNLIWLSLFLRGGVGHLGAAVVGVAALGLHQVHVHALFSAPFLTAVLLGAYERRIALAPYLVAYGISLPAWLLWPELATYLETGDVSVLPVSIWEVDYLTNYLSYSSIVVQVQEHIEFLLLSVNILRFIVWISPALVFLTLLAFLAPKRLGLIPWLCFSSLLLTVVASHILMPNQTHTWGSRYYHPTLGSLVIFAVAGWVQFKGWRRLTSALAVMMMLSTIILMPLRALQVEERIGPRADLQKYVEALPFDYVIAPALPNVDFLSVVRNDPFLRNRPLIIFVPEGEAVPELPGKGYTLTAEDADRAGLPHGTYLEPGLRWPSEAEAQPQAGQNPLQ